MQGFVTGMAWCEAQVLTTWSPPRVQIADLVTALRGVSDPGKDLPVVKTHVRALLDICKNGNEISFLGGCWLALNGCVAVLVKRCLGWS